MHREPAGHGHHIAIEAVVRAPADGYTLTPLRAFSKLELLANAGLVAHCSACLMSMMAAWYAAVGAPSCATAFIAARTASMCELIMSVVLRAAST